MAGRARKEEERRQEDDREARDETREGGRGRRGEGRLTRRFAGLLRPWWERNPELLRLEYEALRRDGFRVRHGARPDGRLELRARRGDREYLALYPHDFPNEPATVLDGPVTDPQTRITFADASPVAAHGGIDQLLHDQPVVHQRLASCFPVLCSATWHHFVGGEGGDLELGEGAGQALAAIALTGSSDDLRIRAESAPLRTAFPRVVHGTWVRGPAPDWSSTDEEIVAEIERRIAQFRRVSLTQVRFELRFTIGALVYNDERSRLGEILFVRRTRSDAPLLGCVEPYRPLGSLGRAPFSGELRGKRVALIGCGALGWSVALSLARAGVTHFDLFDRDRVHASNLPRLAARLSSVGEYKVDALAREIYEIAPAARVDGHSYFVGRDIGARALIAVKPDLVLDASADSASPGESNVAAVALGVPAIFAWTSVGVLAARIFRVVPPRTACYACVRAHAPRPIRSERPVPGWSEEFVWNGANFNIEIVAAATSRMAVRTLLGHVADASNPDHVVLDVGDALPRSRVLAFERIKNCEVCS